MASFNDKDTNVLFSNVSVGTALGGKYYNGNNGDFSDAATDGVEPFVNAVEIDWNGANIANKTVNTTGELLKIINDLYGQVNNAKVSSIQLSQPGTWEPINNPTAEITVYAYVHPDNAYNKNVYWECYNAAPSHLVTIGSAYESHTNIKLNTFGTGTIRCTAQDGSGVYSEFNINSHPAVTATILYGEGVSGGTNKDVTPAKIKNGKKVTNISVNLFSLDKYSYFSCPGYTTSHSIIIRLPSNTGSNIYPTDVRFQDINLEWRPIGYLNSDNEDEIKVYNTNDYSYFVITSYRPASYSEYSLCFTKTNPNYGNVLPDPT